MSTVKSKKLQVGTDASASNNFTIYQPATPDGTLRIGVGNADSPTEVARFDSTGLVLTTVPLAAAVNTSGMSYSGGVYTKVTFQTTTYDTTSDFDLANNRYTPSVAGYYQVYGSWQIDNNYVVRSAIYKNGTNVARGPQNNSGFGAQVTALVYLNGSTDYVELYAYSSATFTSAASNGIRLEAHLITRA